jgi:hypothetical protein
MKKIIVWSLLILFLFSCAPKQFIPFEPPDVVFEKTPEYVLDLDSITKPEKIKAIYVDENFKEVPKEEAKFVVLAPKEYAKISALLKLAKAYKEIAKEQEVLINTNISVINSLKEYVALEQMKAKEYRQLWADSENAYRQENYNRKIDNAIYKGTFGAIFLGVILAIVAL